MPEFIEKTYKSFINKKKFIDSWFWDRYTLNPYNGCQFGCVYCDARSAKYHMPEDFENKIMIKQDVGRMLDQRIARARTFLPDVVGIGSVTDAYQPAEKKYQNTRQCLKILARHRYPVHIITKSTLIVRDLDLLEEIGGQTWCCVSLTIPTVNEKAAAFLDKYSPSPTKRLEVIAQIKSEVQNVRTGALLIPLVPFLCDSDKDLEDITKAVKDAGADYLLFGGGMTLRDQQALWFLRHLQVFAPEILKKYEKLYRFQYSSEKYTGAYTPGLNYLKPKHEKLFELCDKQGLSFRIPRYLPNDFRRSNYQIAEQLFREAYSKQMLGQD